MAIHQLFNIIPEMVLGHYFNSARGELVLREANNTPFMRWPDGMPCSVANAYMIHLLKRNLSRNNKGGTLRQYAIDISHLIRYCHNYRIQLCEIDYDRFTHFVGELRKENDPINPNVRKRDSNTLIAIGRKCLDFLDFVGYLNGDDNFVASTVRGEKKNYSVKGAKSKASTIIRHGWWHPSFDTPGPRKKRNAISQKSIEALYSAIPKLPADSLDSDMHRFLCRRRTVMIRLLEMTGARIEEVARIRVQDIERAIAQKQPELRLETLKRRKEEVRYVPVLHQDLVALKPYYRVSRARIIRSTIGRYSDHGVLFIGDQGKPLTSRYMSNEVGLLRRAAGLPGQVCAHMFRHRFITKLFVRFIIQYEYENKDDFRKALLDAQTLKQKVQQYTGHGSIVSLDAYIDLAFEEVANLDEVVNAVDAHRAYESFDDNVELLHKELDSGLPVSVYLERYRELCEMRASDIGRTSTVD